MVVYSHETCYCLAVVLDWPRFARVNVREIRPTVFTVMSFIIDHKVIAKTRPIIFMHTNSKLSFERSKLLTLEILRRRYQETLRISIFFVYPIGSRLPRERTISNNNIIKLSFSNSNSIGNTITFLMECLSIKIVLSCPVQQMNVVDLSPHHFLKILKLISHNTRSKFPLLHIHILNHLNMIIGKITMLLNFLNIFKWIIRW